MTQSKALQQLKGTLCYYCQNISEHRLRKRGKHFIALSYGCGNYGFNRGPLGKGFKPRTKKCKHFDANY